MISQIIISQIIIRVEFSKTKFFQDYYVMKTFFEPQDLIHCKITILIRF